MANGAKIKTLQASNFADLTIEIHAMLDGQAGASDGVWVDVHGAESVSMAISGIGTGTIQCRGHHPTDGQTTPTNSNHHEKIGSDVTSDGQYGIVFQDVPHWIKVRKSSAGNSTSTTVIAHIKYPKRRQSGA